jgi:glycolate oxidase FAD binding subunit
MDHLSPQTEGELSEIVADACARYTPISVIGRGTKSGWGRAVDPVRSLSLANFRGIIDYSPGELVLTARAGTPLAEIQRAVSAEGQHLAFEPLDLGLIFDQAADGATIGGVLASNLSGPRRPFAGAARDFFLGFRAVNGRGEAFKAGGKVVKNVTGYDLPKLMAGSFGTLGLMTEITLKILPAPETSLSVVVPGLGIMGANAAITTALGSTADPTGAAYLPPAEAARTSVLGSLLSGQSATVLRLEGSAASVSYRRAVLERQFASNCVVLDEKASAAFWIAFGRLEIFAGDSKQLLWLLSVPPTTGGEVVQSLLRTLPDSRYALDWGGGRIWFSVAANESIFDAYASIIRAAFVQGGHASLIRAPATLRRGDHLFSPEAPIDLLKRVRLAFDPKRILNRARLHSDL